MTTAERLATPLARRLALLLLLLVLGGVLVLLTDRQPAPPGPVPQDEAGEPDYYLEQAELVRYDAEGLAHQRLNSPRLVHTPHDDVLRAETPRAELLDNAGRRWTVRGERGTLADQRLTLSGDARLNAPDAGWRLDTQELHLNTRTGHAWSDVPARFEAPPQHVEAERFEAWLEDERLHLEGRVRGHHPPARQ
ncbi:LPS export ABC transporter periplasmic protein LptC [Halomonas pacifica]|uniref:LPS export ABC transporter periplasmic protein LptC n=1 Tax=Bisbaumannia pacifica TaxID=77098 RepID=UPI0023591306|nr:LPS export ABC transporter periplasmic protein LptC [Halomonas pacifica]MDC8803371.1 LPS export ABC transporter periplasmic protein LptC [Halomonas pacifica]